MSRIERIQTKQGHPIPKTAGYTQGPFPAELYRSLPVVEHYESRTGNGGPEIPDEGTAQNGFRAPRWFKCRYCEEIISEQLVESHVCEEVDTDGQSS
jgi:hypothetical protein